MVSSLSESESLEKYQLARQNANENVNNDVETFAEYLDQLSISVVADRQISKDTKPLSDWKVFQSKFHLYPKQANGNCRIFKKLDTFSLLFHIKISLEFPDSPYDNPTNID